MNDDRKGLPSASNIHRLAACPGSHRLCAGIPDKPTDDSNFGTRVHQWLAGVQMEPPLSAAELDIAESCQKIEADVLAQWKLRYQIPDDAEIAVTRDSARLWLTVKGQPVCSGVADVVYLHQHRALILDYKTLPGDHADGSENLQLRTLAVLADDQRGGDLCSADVAIIQPLKTHSPQVCVYDESGLVRAECELMEILRAAQQPDAPLQTGDHCKFCRASSICPAVHKELETLSTLTIHENGLTVSDEKMAELRGKCGAAKKMIASIEAEAFRRAEADPGTWEKLGWRITEGSGKRAVENVAMVGERLNALGASWIDISGECSITIKSVETLTRSATKEKGMGLKRKVDEVLEGCVEVKTAKPSLKRIGTTDEE